jgi:FMN phosphatase YigB (HAD superfamily)
VGPQIAGSQTRFLYSMNNIKNIIFDLGGVLFNIDFNKTFAAFEALGVKNIRGMYGQHHANELFQQLETGMISEKEFFAVTKQFIPGDVTNEQVEEAWDAMLLDFRLDSLACLEALSGNYKIYLLSNTNAIHLRRVHQILQKETGKASLDDYFNKAWYSHLVGLRKPGREIYEFVLKDAGIRASETFFIDDTEENIQPAEQLGIKTKLLLPGEKIEDLF